MADESIRLSKYLSQNNVCSRREAELFIERGWLRVDGQLVTRQGVRVSESSHIELDPRATSYQSRFTTVLLNKPVGYVSGQPEPGCKPAATLIKKSNLLGSARGKETQQIRWPLTKLAPAGRLDLDSSGLLVLTQDGRIARQLIGPDSRIEKEYMVRTAEPFSESQIEQLKFGMSLDGVTLRKATVEPIDSNYFRIVLTEGRNRQIRRMCDIAGMRVFALKRVRIGRIRLASLPLGKWRPLLAGERF